MFPTRLLKGYLLIVFGVKGLLLNKKNAAI